MISIQWLNVTTNGFRSKKMEKGTKKVVEWFSTRLHFCRGAVLGVKGRLGGGGGIGREGVQVRERWRVGWIEEAERKTTVCGLKEGSDMNHVFFLSPTTCSLLCILHKRPCFQTWCTLNPRSFTCRKCGVNYPRVPSPLVYMCMIADMYCCTPKP